MTVAGRGHNNHVAGIWLLVCGLVCVVFVRLVWDDAAWLGLALLVGGAVFYVLGWREDNRAVELHRIARPVIHEPPSNVRAVGDVPVPPEYTDPSDGPS